MSLTHVPRAIHISSNLLKCRNFLTNRLCFALAVLGATQYLMFTFHVFCKTAIFSSLNDTHATLLLIYSSKAKKKGPI